MPRRTRGQRVTIRRSTASICVLWRAILRSKGTTSTSQDQGRRSPPAGAIGVGRSATPDLFIIQSIDNDIRCDGTDADNYEPYGHKIDAVLASIVAGAPTARIYVVGVWATVQNYTDVTQKFPAAVGANQGGGPCDVFDQSGQELPSAMAYYQDVIDHYQANLKFGCDLVPSCQYGGDEIGNMALAGDDLAPDFNHLSIQGQAKMAETAWTALNS